MFFQKLVVLDSVIFFPEHRRRLDAIAGSVVEYSTCTDENQVNERCLGADGIISCWVDIPRCIIDTNSQLKAVAFWTHDYEHRIDAAYARKRGVYVPAIPDYGTDSVAELVFIGLLALSGKKAPAVTSGEAADTRRLAEEIVFRFADDIRRFTSNAKDARSGRWIHEYVKTGQLRIVSPDEIPGETLKGLTVGLLGPEIVSDDIVDIVARGLRMNLIYSGADGPHSLDATFRPIDDLLAESQVLVYDGRYLPPSLKARIETGSYLSRVDVAGLSPQRRPLQCQRLGIVGLGRIGSRVAQIAVEGFGMEVVYTSRTPKPELERRLGLTPVPLDELITASDIISLHLPHHGAEDFVTRELIERIPAGTTLVNCSVGSVIADENALLDRCEKGELQAFLDVYRTLPPKERLRAAAGNVLATYRLGWRTKATVGLKTHKLLTKLECQRQPRE